jgi:hypothetical protein
MPPPGFTLLFTFPQWDWYSNRIWQIDVYVKN